MLEKFRIRVYIISNENKPYFKESYYAFYQHQKQPGY